MKKACLFLGVLLFGFFPSLAMGIIFSQLKKYGHDVSQDDLSIRFHHDYYSKGINKQYKYEIFFQEERIKEYAESGTDDELENEIKKILGEINIEDIDIFFIHTWESL